MTFKYANLFTILFHHIKCNVIEKINIQLPQYWKKKKLNPEFIKELDTLDTDIKTLLTPHKDKAFMVFHPSWGYFAKRYDLEQISIEIEGKEPKPNELVELIEEAKKHDIKIVFVAPQFSQKSAKTISKNINANVVEIDPLSDNWKESMLNTANQIANSYK